MRRHPVYVVVALLLIATLAWAERRGWTPTPPTEVRNVPRSVRDNPGSYRPAYHPFFFGGGGYLRGK